MKWTKEELNFLKKLIDECYNYVEISEKLNRSVGSIHSKVYKLGLRLVHKVISKCYYCESMIEDYKSSNRKFCSNSCSSKYNNKNRQLDYNKFKESICVKCGEGIIVNIRSSNNKCKCEKCKKENKREYYKKRRLENRKVKVKKVSYKSEIRKCKLCENIAPYRKTYCDECSYSYYEIYRPRCNFNFNLSDYPNEFNFDLIREYGWYSPSNKNNNLNGISRDHIYSVRDGFINNIDPKIISHPANCQLLIHKDNNSKNKKSEITINDLFLKIKEFDKKYNK